MPLPDSLHAFTTEFEAFDRAVSAEKGIRIEFSDPAPARAYRARLHQARVLDRRENRVAYKEGDPMYGRSSYDSLRVTIREDTAGKHWVYIEKQENIPGTVEEL